jgi:predicted ATPase/DNA-binding SARP family transcriptional activator/Tfp pilus assembly protein PilF
MSELTLTLLGSPRLARDGAPIHLRSRKCIAMLAYLAVTSVSHARASLAALFWPESDAKRALGALRYTLSLLRRPLQDAWLVVEREAIGLDGSERTAVDVIVFRDLLAQCCTHGHPVQETCPACRPLLAEAVDLYRGDFMAGFTLRDSPEFDDWQRFEAQVLRQEQATALERLAQGCAAQGDTEAAVAFAQRWVALDPLHEPAHRYLMRLYALSGQQADAIRQYEACEGVLQAELGESPDQATTSLYQAIKERMLGQPLATASAIPRGPPGAPAKEGRGEEWMPPSEAQVARRHNLPPEPTPFVGREGELGQIAQLLADPGCRLLSIVGPGGIGKSRLALRAGMAHVQHFPHGVYLVPLGPLESPELLASTIINALGIPSHGSLTPGMQLLNVLRERHLLLILDNFEHLLEGTTLIAEILEGAPGVKLLVTSRERLNLREEWLLPLEGMRVPTAEQAAGIREEEAAAIWEGAISETCVATLQGYPAIQLFVQCARRMRPDFSLLTAGASSVAHICRLVEGMPLAIELAAPWTRVMHCQTLAREIEGSLGVLATSLRNVPHRHRSMRAAFDHSWGLLPVEERDVLRQLSVFRGGFRREAAEAVAVRLSQSPASLALLSALVDSSWLRATPSGRYEMHELVRQYCEEQLEQDPEDSGQVRGRHSKYYAGFLDKREARLKGRGQKEALESILEEMGNIRAAWDWTVKRGNVEALGRCLESLFWVGLRRGWQHEVMQSLGRAVAMLREQPLVKQSLEPGPPAGETALLLGRILCHQGHLALFFEGFSEGVVALCEESLALLEGLAPSVQQQKACTFAKARLGWFLDARGDSSRARELLQEALAQATEADDDWNRGYALWMLGGRFLGSGEYSEAEGYLREAIAIWDRLGDQARKAWCVGMMRFILWTRGEYEAAESLAEEEVRIRRELGDPQGMDAALGRLAVVETALGKYDEASRHYRDMLALAEEYGNPLLRYEFLSGMGTIAAAQGKYREAAQLLDDAVTSAYEIGHARGALMALVRLGHVVLALGEGPRAAECFHQALRDAMEATFIPGALGALVGLASLSAKAGELQRAAELVSLALQHPTTYHVDRVRAQDLLSQLESELSPEVLSAATARGQARELEEVTAELLRELEAVPDRSDPP